jgi:hypothetical protein
MALVFWGSTKCGICGQVLNVGDQIDAFPSIVQNELDPLYHFNDEAFHQACLMNSPDWERINIAFKQFLLLANLRKCTVCGNSITNPGECVNLGLLTTNKDDLLFRYNFLSFHKEHFSQWAEKGKILSYLKEQKAMGLWTGKNLDWIFDV